MWVFSSVVALGMKLFCSLEVRAVVARLRLPEGSREKRWFAGLILQNATCSAEAACPKGGGVSWGRQWKSDYFLSRPHDPTEGFPVLVWAVDVPCIDTVCDDTFNATVVK